jgi:hypothetical protein
MARLNQVPGPRKQRKTHNAPSTPSRMPAPKECRHNTYRSEAQWADI